MKHLHTFENFLNKENVNEQDKVVLGDGKLTPIKRGDMLRFTDAAKKTGVLGKLLQPYLDDAVEFDSMAGGALRIKIDGDVFIVDPSRFIKESEDIDESIAFDLDSHIDTIHNSIMKMRKEAKTQEEKKIIAKLMDAFSRFDNEVGKLSDEFDSLK